MVDKDSDLRASFNRIIGKSSGRDHFCETLDFIPGIRTRSLSNFQIIKEPNRVQLDTNTQLREIHEHELEVHIRYIPGYTKRVVGT